MSNTEIVKPLSVERNELMEGLVTLINKHNALPYFVVEDVLINLRSEIHALAVNQLQADTEYYNKQKNEE